MVKPVGWRSALNAYIVSIQARPLVFGEHDCAVGLAFPAIEIQTGDDLGAPFRGNYGTFLDGAKLYKLHGYESLAEMMAAHFEEVHPSQAQFGDIASMPSEHEGWSLGVVLGERIGVLTGEGFGTAPRSTAVRAFRVK